MKAARCISRTNEASSAHEDDAVVGAPPPPLLLPPVVDDDEDDDGACEIFLSLSMAPLSVATPAEAP